MKSTTFLPALAAIAAAKPVELEQRQSCPGVYVFGARETTAPAGYGTSAGLVNSERFLVSRPNSGPIHGLGAA